MTAVSTFILAMIVHPDVQRKAQAEFASFLREDRLPNLDDKEHLLHISCIVSGVFRWMPPLPTGVAHTCMKDNEYEGYNIPAGKHS